MTTDALESLASWQQDVTDVPLVEGTSSWAVTALKQLLVAAGETVANDTVEYDDVLVALVGPSFDGAAATALLAKVMA